MNTVGFEQHKSKGKVPWLLIGIVISWYLLYGLGLRATYQPLLFWLVAAATASCLAGVVTTYQFLAVPLCLGASWGLSLPLLINTLVVRANNWFEKLLELYEQKGWLGILISGASVLLLALCWYSPLFFCQRRMTRNGFSRQQVFFMIAIASWLGLFLGWLLGAAIS